MRRRAGRAAMSSSSSSTSSSAAASASSWGLPRSLSWVELLVLLLSLALLLAGADARFPAWLRAALRPYDTATVPLASLSDAQLQSGVMLVVYVAQYVVLGGLLEGTHPDGALSSSLTPARLAQRREQVRSEFATGMFSMAVTVVCAVLWMWKLEPLTPFYGYFAAHELTPALAVGGVLAYIAAFDTHFYWSHWLLHESTFLWNNVHVSPGFEERRRAQSVSLALGPGARGARRVSPAA